MHVVVMAGRIKAAGQRSRNLNFVHVVAGSRASRLMRCMHWLRTTGRLPRALIAVLFGIVTLMPHLPVMTTAKAAPAISQMMRPA